MSTQEPAHERKPTILVVDDDRLVRVTIAAGLREHGYQVIEAESGEEGLTLALAQHVDLALLDVKMEGMSGLELAEQLRARTSIPSVFLSAYGDADLVREAGQHGALGYLVKPIDPSRVVPAIETALARAREIGELRRAQSSMAAELAGAREVSLATGILMERSHLDRINAFELLRRHARSQRRKLRDVAAEVVEAAETLNLVR
jgi:response regulator NasT